MQMKSTSIGYIAIIVLLLITSFLSLKLFLEEKKSHDKIDIHIFPYQVGDWKGKDLTITEEEYKILETRNLIAREYVSSRNEKVGLFIIYSETNRAVFHPPEVCLIGEGIAIVDKKAEQIKSGKYEFVTNKLFTEKGNFKSLILYSYKAGNLYTDNFYFQQMYLAFHQIFGRRIPGATIRVLMPIAQDELATLQILKSFLTQTVTIIDGLTTD